MSASFERALKFNPAQPRNPAGTPWAPTGPGPGRWAKAQSQSGVWVGASNLNPRNLSMDESSRLARARAMGFDIERTWFHGTLSDFTQFEEQFANTQAYFGPAFYFSDDPSDVEMNYTNPDSPDWQAKIDNKIEQELRKWQDQNREATLDEENAAAHEIEAHIKSGIDADAGVMLETFLKITNPFDLTTNNVVLPIEEEYDAETEEYTGEVSGKGFEFIEALEGIAVNYGLRSLHSEQLRFNDLKSDLWEELSSGGSTPKRIWKKLINHPGISYLEDDEGNMVPPGRVVKEALQAVGFDAIIMDAYEHFPKIVPSPGTKHAIVFDPTQIRLTTAVFDPEEAKSGDIRKWDPNQPRAPKGSSIGGRWIDSVKFRNETTDAYSGQTNHRVTAEQNGKVLGRLSYTVYGGEAEVSMIEVDPEFQRRGIASRLMGPMIEHAKEKGLKVTTSLQLPEGVEFFKKFGPLPDFSAREQEFDLEQEQRGNLTFNHIVVGGEKVGHISGYEEAGHFYLYRTEISPEYRGTGLYQQAVQRVADQYRTGVFVYRDDASPQLQKALRKMPTFEEWDTEPGDGVHFTDDGLHSRTGYYVHPVRKVEKYDPSQPREPAGTSIGGRWAKGAGSRLWAMGASEHPLASLRGYLPKVRGGWTLPKIQRQLRKTGSLHSPHTLAKTISQFDSPEEFAQHLFWHGTGGFVSGGLRAGGVLGKNAFRSGGYDERYHTISLSRSKRMASAFTGDSDHGTVYMVVLRKGAKVIDMPEVQDSIELEEHLPRLWDEGVDAVRLGKWDDGSSEEELAVLNPRALVLGPSEGFRVFGMQGLTPAPDSEAVRALYEQAKVDYARWQAEAPERQAKRRAEAIASWEARFPGTPHPYLEVQKYAPDQPRTPKGTPEGGRWTKSGRYIGALPRGGTFRPRVRSLSMSFKGQKNQYPDSGPPGISYYPGYLNDPGDHVVDCLLYRDQDGKLVGILNHFGFDLPPYQKKGDVLVMVDPEQQRKGIGTALLREAGKLYDIDLSTQKFTAEGAALANAVTEPFYTDKDPPPPDWGKEPRKKAVEGTVGARSTYTLYEVFKYSPNQPRHPKGSPNGGRWSTTHSSTLWASNSPRSKQWTPPAGATLYHVTLTTNAQKIQQEGLLTFKTSNWVKAGNKQRYGEGEVFAFENRLDAIRWAGRWDWELHKDIGTGKISILEVTPTDPWEIDTADPLSQAGAKGKWLKHRTSIPPEQIGQSVPVTLEMTRLLTQKFDPSQPRHPKGTSIGGRWSKSLHSSAIWPSQSASTPKTSSSTPSKAPPGHTRLYHGGANVEVLSLDAADPRALFGAGIYLTNSPRLSNDYKLVRGLAERAGVTRLGAGFKSKAEAIERFLRLKAQHEIGPDGQPYKGMAPEWPIWEKQQRPLLAGARKWWEREKKNWIVRRQVDGTWLFAPKPKDEKTTRHEYDVPDEILHKMLDAERGVDDKAVSALVRALNTMGDRSTGNAIWDFVEQRRKAAEWEQTDEEGNWVEPPTYRDIYTSITRNSPLISSEGQIELRRNLKEAGYSGIRYQGGLTMGGQKHEAYVLWNEQGLRKWKRAKKYEIALKFNPNQPRHPKGHPEGGHWSKGLKPYQILRPRVRNDRGVIRLDVLVNPSEGAVLNYLRTADFGDIDREEYTDFRWVKDSAGNVYMWLAGISLHDRVEHALMEDALRDREKVTAEFVEKGFAFVDSAAGVQWTVEKYDPSQPRHPKGGLWAAQGPAPGRFAPALKRGPITLSVESYEYKRPGVRYTNKVPALMNPSRVELLRWAGGEVKSVRWVQWEGNALFWNAYDGLHQQVMEALRKDGTITPETFTTWTKSLNNGEVSSGEFGVSELKLPNNTLYDDILQPEDPKDVWAMASGDASKLVVYGSPPYSGRHWDRGKDYQITVVTNPTREGVLNWMGRDIEYVRGLHLDTGEVLFWNAEDAIHAQVIRALGKAGVANTPSSGIHVNRNDILNGPYEKYFKQGVQKFDPAQPRHPKGVREGGRWSKVLGRASSLWAQIAFHGSPTSGITRFDLSKIGTGEGNTSYGWGMYFAQARAVGSHYAVSLVNPRFAGSKVYKITAEMDGTDFNVWEAHDVSYAATGSFLDWAPINKQRFKTSEEAEQWLREEGLIDSQWIRKDKTDTGKYIPRDPSNADYHESDYFLTPKGELYEVNIPDSALKHMLDWDAPVDKQPKVVLQAMADAKVNLDKLNHHGELRRGRDLYDHLKQRMLSVDGNAILTVAGLNYREVVNNAPGGSAQLASVYLGAQGVPGLRYLDQDSRVRVDGTRNYVIWDQDLLDKIPVKVAKFDPAQPRHPKGVREGGRWSKGVNTSAIWGYQAFHGSPKTGTKRFDLAHVGSGEGAAAFGWGMYFADEPGVAGHYTVNADNVYPRLYLHGKDITSRWNESLDVADNHAISALTEVSRRNKVLGPEDFAKAREELQSHADRLAGSRAGEIYERSVEKLNEMEGIATGGELKYLPGAVYRVDFPDHTLDRMLDWDAPLSQQPEGVKRAYAEVLKYFRQWDPMGFTDSGGNYKYVRNGALSAEPDGAGIYGFITKMVQNSEKRTRGTIMWDPEKKASAFLLSHGVPGNKYLDAESRNSALNPYRQVRRRSDNVVVQEVMDTKAKAVFDEIERQAPGEFTLSEPIDNRSRNYVIWDQSVLDQVKVIEETHKLERALKFNKLHRHPKGTPWAPTGVGPGRFAPNARGAMQQMLQSLSYVGEVIGGAARSKEPISEVVERRLTGEEREVLDYYHRWSYINEYLRGVIFERRRSHNKNLRMDESKVSVQREAWHEMMGNVPPHLMSDQSDLYDLEYENPGEFRKRMKGVMETWAGQMDSALSKLKLGDYMPEGVTELPLYRGIKQPSMLRNLAKMQVGSTISDSGYSTFSMSPWTAYSFGGTLWDENRSTGEYVLFRTVGKPHHHGQVSIYEQQVILPRNQKYRITDIRNTNLDEVLGEVERGENPFNDDTGKKIKVRVYEIEPVEDVQKFDPKQPRDPAGVPTGGQWAAKYSGRQGDWMREHKAKQREFAKSNLKGLRYDAELTGERLPLERLTEQMDFMRTMQQRNAQQHGLRYGGMEDFVLGEGREFDLPDAPPPIKLGVPKECFSNAVDFIMQKDGLSEKGRYRYVEGYVMSPKLPMAIHHAWVEDTQTGLALDPTLGWNPKARYYGVSFEAKYLRTKLVEHGYYGLFTGDVIVHDLVLGKDSDFKYKAET